MPLSAAQLNSLVNLYVGYFNRAPDPTGLGYWISQYDPAVSGSNAMSLSQIANSFAVQTEAKTQYPFLTAPTLASVNTFLTSIYANLFNRAYNPSTDSYWATQISNGMPVGQAIVNIISGATGADLTTLQNKSAAGLNWAQSMANVPGAVYTQGSVYASSAFSTVAGVNATPASVTAANASTTAFFTTGAGVPTIPGQIYTLTTGPDTFVGTAGNDTFNAPFNTGVTFTGLDTLNGNGGNDTLNISTTGAFTGPSGVSITGINNYNLSATTGAVWDTSSTTSYVGLKNESVSGSGVITLTTQSGVNLSATNSTPGGAATTLNGGAANTVIVTGSVASTDTVSVGATSAPTGAVSVNTTTSLNTAGASAAGATVTVKGGSTVSVTENISNSATANTATAGAVTVMGTANTTSVTVNQSGFVTVTAQTNASLNANNAVAAVGGVAAGAVTISDVNAGSAAALGTITFGNSTISSNALATLTLSSTGKDTTNSDVTSGTLGLTEGAAPNAPTALALNLGGGRVGVITDNSNQYKSLNVNMTANTRIGGFVDTALTAVTVGGTGVLRNDSALGSTVTSLTLSGAAGYRGDISSSGITALTEANTTGGSNVTINATAQSFTGGAGNDTVTISANATKAISGGGGTDTINLGAVAGSTFTAASTGVNVTNFNTLGINGTTGTVDYSVFQTNNTISTISDNAASTVTVSKVLLGTNLVINTSGDDTGTFTYALSDFNGFTDSVNVSFTGATPAVGTGTIGYTLTGLTLQDAGGIGIANVNITTDASVGGGAYTISTLTDPNLSSLRISGTGALTVSALTDTSASLSITDNSTSSAASAITLLTDTGLANLSYSGTHAAGFSTAIANDAATAVTISNSNGGSNTTSASLLTIGTSALNSATTINLSGAVAATLTDSAAAAVTVNGGTDHANVSITLSGNGVDKVTLGNGSNTVVTGTSADTITLGSGANTVTGGLGIDTITFGAHSGVDTVVYNTAAAATVLDSGTYTPQTTNAVMDASVFEVVKGLQSGDKLALAAGYTSVAANAANLVFNSTTAPQVYTTLASGTLQVGANQVEMVRGNYSAATQQFIGSATGSDSLFIYDSNAATATTAAQAVVLVGYAAANSPTAAFANAQVVITLA